MISFSTRLWEAQEDIRASSNSLVLYGSWSHKSNEGLQGLANWRAREETRREERRCWRSLKWFDSHATLNATVTVVQSFKFVLAFHPSTATAYVAREFFRALDNRKPHGINAVVTCLEPRATTFRAATRRAVHEYASPISDALVAPLMLDSPSIGDHRLLLQIIHDASRPRYGSGSLLVPQSGAHFRPVIVGSILF